MKGTLIMKSSKNYIIISLAIQMIGLPIVLTAGLIGMSGVLGHMANVLSNAMLGKEAIRLIYIFIAVFSAFIVGGVMGLTFSIMVKSKPESAGARYLPPIFPIIYALFFAIIASVFSNENYNSGLWMLYFYKNPFLFLFNVGLALSGLSYVIPVAEISAYAGFAAGLFFHEKLRNNSIKDKPARNFRMGFGALCIIFIAFVAFNSRTVINNGMIELKYGRSTIGNELTEFDLTGIAPFKKNNGVAKLGGKASLEFTAFDEMPRLDGATAVYPVYSAFVEAVYKGLGDYYEANKDNNDKDVFLAFVSSESFPFNIVKCSKTVQAYENLINGRTDIIFAAEPSKAQTESIKARGDEFVLTPIGSEAFVFFTNRLNPVDNLTITQIQDIYSGKTTNWKALGGENRRILPYQRPEDSGSQTIMQNRVMKGIEMLNPTKETFAGGMGEVISQIASYKNAKNAIGYSFMYYSSSMIKSNQIKYISIDGVKPAPETVRSGKYPFTVPVYAVSLKSSPNKNVLRFIEWILSGEGQSLIEKTGYVPVKPEEVTASSVLNKKRW